MESKRVEHLGNGRMLVAFCGADILSIHAPSADSAAACSIFLPIHAPVVSEYEQTGIIRRSVSSAQTELRLTDMIDPERCVFLRQISAYEKMTLRLSMPPGTRRVLYDIKGEMRLILQLPSSGGMTVEPIVLSITVRGNAQFLSATQISVAPGQSEIVIVGGALPAAAYEIHHPPESDELIERVLAFSDGIKTAKEIDQINRLCESGGLIHDAASGECRIDEQGSALSTLLSYRRHAQARAMIDFWLGVECSNGFLPYAVTPSGVVTRRGAFPAVFAAYPALWLKAYFDATGDKKYVRGRIPQIARLMEAACALVRGGHLPFHGCEEFFEPGMPGSRLFAGSRRSDELFAAAADALVTLASDLVPRTKGLALLARTRDAVTAALCEYASDAPDASLNRRASLIRAPRVLYVHCEECAQRGLQTVETACVHAPDGRYLCTLCHAARHRTAWI